MTTRNGVPAPRARKKGLVVRELPDEVLVYDLERHKAHCLGLNTAWIWRQCDGRTTAAQMAARLRKEHGADAGEGEVWVALRRLDRARLLEARVSPPPAFVDTSRREWLKKAAAVGGLTVLTITAPTPAMAVTCVPDVTCCATPQVGGVCPLAGRVCCTTLSPCVKPSNGPNCSCSGTCP